MIRGRVERTHEHARDLIHEDAITIAVRCLAVNVPDSLRLERGRFPLVVNILRFPRAEDERETSTYFEMDLQDAEWGHDKRPFHTSMYCWRILSQVYFSASERASLL